MARRTRDWRRGKRGSGCWTPPACLPSTWRDARRLLPRLRSAAGVTRGAIYWHFRDKAALFYAMCERATLPLDALFERAGEAAATRPLATLRDLCVGALQRLRHRCAHAGLVSRGDLP